MAKTHLNLQASESTIVQAAANIYASYVVAGKVADGKEAEYLKKSIGESIRIAKTVEEMIVAEGEMS